MNNIMTIKNLIDLPMQIKAGIIGHTLMLNKFFPEIPQDEFEHFLSDIPNGFVLFFLDELDKIMPLSEEFKQAVRKSEFYEIVNGKDKHDHHRECMIAEWIIEFSARVMRCPETDGLVLNAAKLLGSHLYHIPKSYNLWAKIEFPEVNEESK